MSSQGVFDIFSLSLQKSVVSANLNSALVFLFLCGGYFPFYIFTLKIYASRPQSRRTVIYFLSALFAITVAQVIAAWYSANACFVISSSSITVMFEITMGLASVNIPVLSILPLVLQSLGQILADALLIWRCWFILTERRYFRLSLVALFMAGIGLTIAGAVMNALFNALPSFQTVQFAHQQNILQGAISFVTAATSIISTIIIGVHIYVSTKFHPQTRKRYTYIIDIMIQSSAIYSLSMLSQAILAFIDPGIVSSSAQSALSMALIYTYGISLITTAFAPTLMVARLEIHKNETTAEYWTDVVDDIPSEIIANPTMVFTEV